MEQKEQLIKDIARALYQAEQQRVPIAPLTETYPSLTPAQAYAIQSALLEIKRKESAREIRLFGHKVGLTNQAMQKQLGIDTPDYGVLLDSMVVPPGSTVARADFILPRIEPEIGFWLAQDVRGPGVTAEQVLAATRGLSAALELVDSRIVDWRIKLVDTVADNGSSARVIVSEQVVSPRDFDLAEEAVSLLRNNELVGSGTGAAVLGNPAEAVAWLANKLAEFGAGLHAGQLVIPGAMCAAANASAGETYRATFTHLGDIEVHFT